MSAPSERPLEAAPSLLEQVDLEDSPAQKLFARDLVDGQQVESPFVVRECTRREKRNGEAFLKLRLGDVSGVVDAVVWDDVAEAANAAAPGSVVIATGRYSIDGRYGGCLTIRTLTAASEGSYDPADLLEGPPVPLERLIEDLRDLIDTIQDAHLRELLERLLGACCAGSRP